MVVTVNISNGSEVYSLSEWMAAAISLVYLLMIIVPSQWKLNSASFMLCIVYYIVMVYKEYGMISVPIVVSLPL